MKIARIIAAAGLSIAAVVGATSANAQDWRHHGGDRDRGRYEHRWDRGHHYGWDRGRHYGWNRYHHRHCFTEWRHHRRITICD